MLLHLLGCAVVMSIAVAKISTPADLLY